MLSSAPSIADRHARKGGARVRRLLLDVLALLVIYGNVAVALQPPPLRRMGVRIPRPGFVVDAFLIPGMFSSYSLWNSDFFVLGRRTQTGLPEDRGDWIQLRVREHFPQRHGVIFTELFAAHHWDMHGTAGQRRAWKFLARRIREHHNRLHPERAVSGVRFGAVQWPQSQLGYRAAKTPDAVHTRAWFAEPETP